MTFEPMETALLNSYTGSGGGMTSTLRAVYSAMQSVLTCVCLQFRPYHVSHFFPSQYFYQGGRKKKIIIIMNLRHNKFIVSQSR